MTTDLDDADALVKKLWKTQAALSRAEGTIEKIRKTVEGDGVSKDWRVFAHLTEYDKQKEQS